MYLIEKKIDTKHASEHSFLQSAVEGWSLDAQNLASGQPIEIQASSAQLLLSQQHSNVTSDSLVRQSVAETQLDYSTEKEKTVSASKASSCYLSVLIKCHICTR